MPEEATEMLYWIVVEGNCGNCFCHLNSLWLLYTCGLYMCFKDFAHQKLSSTFLSLYLTSCSGIGVCCEWVLAVGAGRSTSVESEYIVSYKCNI